MKRIPPHIFGALVAALATLSARAASTDTWLGNTDTNWGTSGNWTFSSGSGPVAGGDSLFFGTAGSSGLTLNNNISGLVIGTLTFNSGASSFTFGGNNLTLGGGIDASALTGGTETFTFTNVIGTGLQKWNVGAGGTLAFGAIGTVGGDASDTYSAAGAIAILSKTGTIKTTVANGWGWRGATGHTGPGLLGPGMVRDNGNNTFDWAASTGSTPYTIAAATYTTANNGDANNVLVTANTTVSVNASWASILVSNATLTVNGTQLYVDTGIILENGGTIAGSKPIKANSDGLYIYTPDNGTISVGIQNNGANAKRLYKGGPGTLSLTGGNSYSGGTLVDQGTVSVGNASALGSGALTMNGGNLDCSSANLTLNNNIAQNWNADFVFKGSQKLNLGAGAVTLNATRQVTVTNTLTLGGAIGEGTVGCGLTKAGSGTLILNGVNTYSGATMVNNGVLLFGNVQNAGGVVTVADGAGAGVVAASDTTFWSPSSLTVGTSTGGTLQFNLGGSITGPNANALLTPTSLTLNGTTTIVIGSCPQVIGSYPLFNGYTSGTLTLGSQPPGVLGEITVSGSTVYYQVTNFVTAVWKAAVNTNWDTVTANWTNTIGGNKYISGYPVIFDDTANGASPLLVNITNPVTPNSITVNITNKACVIGGFAIGGATGLTKNGNNSLTLTGTNTFTGDTTVSAGTLEIAGAGQLGGGTYAGNIDDEGTLKYNSTAAQTLSGIISGAGALVVSNGTLTLPGANTFSGGATISNGIVNLGNNNGLGSGTVTLDGGTVQNAVGVTLANNVAVGTGGTIKLGAASDFWLNGSLTGTGNLILGGSSPGINSLNVNFGANSMSAGSITIPPTGPNQTVVRFKSSASGNANIPWSVGGAPDRYVTLDFGTGTIEFGALTGTGVLSGNGGGTKTVQVGGMNSNSTFDGKFLDGSGVVALTKVGSGTLTLTGTNAFSGGVNINGGILCVSNTLALASSGVINFGGGTLQYSAGSQVDYSARIANSASPISIDLNGANVTFAGALPASNTGGLALTNSIGNGVLTLTANNLYTGTTMLNAGALALSGSGNIGASTNITVAAGAIFDVSGVASYTLGASQTLSGSGTVTGAVTSAGIGSSITPGGVGTVSALTFKNSLNLSSGAAPVFDLSTSSASGNDQIVVGGNLALSGNDVIHVNALGGSADLDQTADYVLFSVAGSTTISGHPALVFDNSVPGNFNHYRVATNGNNVVLHYSVIAAPIIASVVVTNTADGSTVGTRGQSVTVYVTVQPGTASVTNVTADLSQLGGSAAQTLNSLGGNEYSYTLLLGPGAVVGTDTITVTATDTTPLSGSGSASFTVNASTDTWNGLATDDNWSSANNWVGSVPPGYTGDTLTFTGSTRTAPVLDNNYSVAGLTFDSAASSFTITNAPGKSLTLAGGVTSSSSSAQALNLPIILSGTQTVQDNNSAGITLGGPVSSAALGSGLTISSGIVTLTGSNTYSGDTTISGGTLKVANSAAIPSGSGKGNVVLSGTLDLNGTNAVINNLQGGAGTVDNTSATSASTLTLGDNNATINLTGVTVQNSGGTNLSLVKVGTGSLTMGSANTFSGGMTISNGTTFLGDNSAAGTGTIALAGGTLENSLNGLSLPNSINATAASALVIGNSLNWYLNGNLTGTGNITYTPANNAATLQLSGTNSGYSGTFTVSGANAAFQWGSASAGSASAAWVLNNTWGLGGRMRFSGGWNGIIDLGALSGNGIGLVNNNAGTVTMSVGALNTSTLFSGTITSQGVGGPIALTKVGTGSLTLSGANTYTGPTVVSNGVLVITTAHAGNGDFTVNDSKMLGVINSGGSAAMGSLTLGNSAGQATLFFTNVVNTGTPIINVAGGVTNLGSCNIAISNSVVNTGSVYPLVKYGSLANAGSFVLSSVPAGVTATLTNDISNLWIALRVIVGNNVNTTPTNITSLVNGNQLILSWPTDHTGWRLQVQTNSLSTGLGSNWVDVPNTSTANAYTNVINPANGSIFYRMVYP